MNPEGAALAPPRLRSSCARARLSRKSALTRLKLRLAPRKRRKASSEAHQPKPVTRSSGVSSKARAHPRCPDPRQRPVAGFVPGRTRRQEREEVGRHNRCAKARGPDPPAVDLERTLPVAGDSRSRHRKKEPTPYHRTKTRLARPVMRQPRRRLRGRAVFHVERTRPAVQVRHRGPREPQSVAEVDRSISPDGGREIDAARHGCQSERAEWRPAKTATPEERP